ncbi:hypothetical protein SPRG_19161 [Saprolegnia parasitica CBS 223.65]|uniref:Uncharacterized protein n=1 Tax=Saprolegnia parasitica (strain CBS 223.65) TaxID=695850 RepID=A0A067D463_SAPPC|nr:hypothetical protein SPRG_19161 [Saprolegnia parasitica CBS 223.65]KDO33526.1 hypothetical protein SPRG_19161 [Saprolegnia parasitica CBS 223.65]|eukprot:XP_012195588.1 hypothetical protein SPRG_19161 [Saprolegnia parasitica CBS 223.65]
MEARVARAMEQAQGPRISLTDVEVAAQIRREAARKKERAKELGVMSYMLPVAPATNVNKGFLLNTIRGVDSHNKRQEIDQCWRKRDLEAKVHRRRSRSRERRHRRRSASPDRRHRPRSASPDRRRRSPSPTRAQDERSYWAERKAARTAELLAQLDGRSCMLENAPNYDEGSSSSESDEASAKAARKAAKKAAKRAKRAKKKAKKAKHA